MALRVRPDPARYAVGLEPLTPRAEAWLHDAIAPLGGTWRTIGRTRAMWLPVADLPETLLAGSGLELKFGAAVRRGEASEPPRRW